MTTNAQALRFVLATAFLLQPLAVQPAPADHWVGRIKRLVGETKYRGTEPDTGEDCAMELLAENIDWLEHHIDTYGSIVAKQPDIWGEARLTKHRDEYERVLFAKLDDFSVTFNAAISQADSSFLSQALALSAAAGGTALTPAADAASVVPSVNAKQINVQARQQGADGATASFARFGITANPSDTSPGVALEPVLQLDQLSRYVNHLHELRRINEGDDTSDSPGYSLNLVRIPVSLLPGKLTRTGFGAEITVTAEPVLSDDLLPTTFQNLVVNDVVDQLRLPVTRIAELYDDSAAEGFTRQSREELDEILADYFKSKQKAEALRESLERASEPLKKLDALALLIQDANEEELSLLLKRFGKGIDTYDSQFAKVIDSKYERVKQNYEEMSVRILNQGSASEQSKDNEGQESSRSAINRDSQALSLSAADEGDSSEREKLKSAREEAVDGAREAVKELIDEINRLIEERQKGVDKLSAEVLAAEKSVRDTRFEFQKLSADTLKDYAQLPSTSGRTRRARHPIPPSQTIDIYGDSELKLLAKTFRDAYFGRHVRWNGGKECAADGGDRECRIHLLDVQRWLDAEASAAYELLAERDQVCLLAALASPSSKLASQIRGGHFETSPNGHPTVKKYRHFFFRRLHEPSPASSESCALAEFAAEQCSSGESAILLEEVLSTSEGHKAETIVESLAWAIVVEAALLNDRLNRDVRKLARAKEVQELETNRDYWFFLPDTVASPAPGLESLRSEFQLASDVFKRYVRVRWPIHVFSIDPREQDQNVADVSVRKRELQFAMALGFVTGQIGANSLTQFSRDLETRVETVGLNRTVVGFGHGSDTFGWRFYPRVQGLEAPGTFGAIRETLCGTSRDYDLKKRKLEPGKRECVAVVLMPSFVPYADFDIRTNWFKLTNPKNSALTMRDAMKLSRAITTMRTSRLRCVKCAHLYREGELRRLMKRVDQLDGELPLQTLRALVPYENTLGGFEMFNTGVTDLSPELIGWYGAPGINVSNDNWGCGCYQGCQLIGGECEGVDCTALKSDLGTLAGRVSALEMGNVSYNANPLPACEGKGTTLFLVGDNFSVHDTKVIAGGVCIPHVRLISREIMQVTIPACVNTVRLCENDKENEYVAVYVSTPYGVTSHLHVPTYESSATPTGCASPRAATSTEGIPPAETLPEPSTGQSRANIDGCGCDRQTVRTVGIRRLPQTQTVRTPFQQVSDHEGELELREVLATQAEALKSAFEQPSPVFVDVALPSVTTVVDNAREANQKSRVGGSAFNEFKTGVRENWRNFRDCVTGNTP